MIQQSDIFFLNDKNILCRGEEDESLAIKPPQQIATKGKSHHRKEEKRKDKRRHRSDSAEGGAAVLFCFI